MRIRSAKKEDAARIMEIIDCAKLSLQKLGLDQWQNGYPNMESILSDIDAGIGHVLVDDGKIIATAAIYVGNEPIYNEISDGQWLTDTKSYGIIHRIAVATDCKNKGSASKMIDYCAEISRAAGVQSLRCDTHFGNTIMQHTLEKNKYVHCGTIHRKDGSLRMAYEKLL